MTEGDLTEIQKAKHAFSIHQDVLLWSRVQTLIAIQTATLAGAYYLGHEIVPATHLTGLGLFLTALLWIIAERDQLQRDKSCSESTVSKTEIRPPFPFSVGGGEIIRLVFFLLAYADLGTLLLVAVGRYTLWLSLPGLIVVCMAWTRANYWIAGMSQDDATDRGEGSRPRRAGTGTARRALPSGNVSASPPDRIGAAQIVRADLKPQSGPFSPQRVDRARGFDVQRNRCQEGIKLC